VLPRRERLRGTDVSAEEELRWLWLACHAAGMVWTTPSWDVLSDRQVTLALTLVRFTLPIALNTARSAPVRRTFTEAASMVAQAESVHRGDREQHRAVRPGLAVSAARKHKPLS